MRRRALLAASAASDNDEIIFYIDIDGVNIEEYSAKQDMTWREWVSSDYNTGGYLINTRYNIISKTSSRLEIGVKHYYGDDYYVSVDDIIEDKHEYYYI